MINKNLFKCIVTVYAVMICAISFAQTAGDYRSNGNGNWSTPSIWQTYNGSAWVTASAPPTSADGIITIQSPNTIDVFSAVTIDEVIISAGATLNQYAPVTINDGPGIDIEILAGGTFLLASGAQTLSGGGSLVNSGAMINNSSSSVQIINGNFTNAGYVASYSGTQLVISPATGSTHSGSFYSYTVNAIEFGGTASHSFTSASSFNGNGLIKFSSGTYDVYGTYGAGSTNLDGGSVNFNQTTDIILSNLTLTAGTLGGTATKTLSGVVSLRHGVVSGGNVTISSNAIVDLLNFANSSVTFNAPVTNNANITWHVTSGCCNANTNLIINNSFTNNGNLTVSGNGNGQVIQQIGGNGTFINGNTGTVTRNTTFGEFNVSVSNLINNGTFIHNGSLGYTSGFNFSGTTFTNTGTFNALSGNVSFSGSTHTFSSTSSVTGSGTVTFTAGIHNIEGNYNPGATTISGGAVNFNQSGPITINYLTLSSGILGGAATKTLSGVVSLRHGVVSGGNVTIPSNATVNLLNFENSSVIFNTSVTSNANITWHVTSGCCNANTNLIINNSFTNNGNLTVSGNGNGQVIQEIGGNGTFINSNTGTVTRNTTFGVFNISISNLINNGIFSHNGSLGYDSYFSSTSSAFVNTGTLNALGGNVNFSGSQNLAGNINVNSGASLNMNGGLTFTGSAITNNGAITGPPVVFAGSTLQQFNGTGNISALTINNINGVTLGGTQTVSSAMNFASGTLQLNSNDLIIAQGASCNGSDISHCYSNGTGGVQRFVPSSASNILFPIGSANVTYRPVILSSTSSHVGHYIKARVIDNLYDNYDGSGNPTGGAIPSILIKRTWILSDVSAGANNLNVTFQWNQLDESPGYIRTGSAARFVKYNTTAWVDNGSVTSSGSNPYTFTKTGITSLGIFGFVNSFIASSGTFGPFCAGASFNLSYHSFGNIGGGTAMLTPQISDASGSFASPVQAGNADVTDITGSGTIQVIIPPNTPSGSGYRVRLVSDITNLIGGDNGSNVVINGAPLAFNITGGGAYCSPGTGVPIGIDGSQTGVNYQLQLGASNIGSLVAGTGSAISFGNQTAAGNYFVTATNVAGCARLMNGNPTITINSAPAITACPANVSGNNTPGLCSTVMNYAAATASGSPAPAITYSQNSGTSFPVGVNTVTVNATNTCSTTSCSFTVTVNDNEAPSITCPADISQCNQVVSFLVPIANDNCNTGLTICNPPSGSSFSIGQTTVNCIATDNHSNQTSCSFNVIITSPPADAGIDQTVCGNSATLAATGVTTPFTGTWSVVSGSGIFSDIHSSTAIVSNIITANNIYKWTVTSTSGCISNDEVSVNATLINANAGIDQTVACNASVTLNGNIITLPTTGLWTVVSGTGSFSFPTLYNTSVTNMSQGINVYRWTVTNGSCVTSDDVTITRTIPVANAGTDQTIPCSQSPQANLSGSVPVPGSGLWTVVSGSGNFSSPNNSSTLVTNVGQGTNVYRWTITLSNCTSADEITVTRTIATANAGFDQTISCTNNIINLSGFPLPGSWSLVSGTGTITTNQLPSMVQISNMSIGANIFRYTHAEGTCTTADEVTVNLTPPVANAGPDQSTNCGSAVVMAANFNSSGTWTVVSGNGIFSDPHDAHCIVSGINGSTNVYRWTVTCGATSVFDDVTITTTPPPAPTITANGPTTFCPGGSVTLTSSVADSYLWSTGATTQSINANVAGNFTVNATMNGCTGTSGSQPVIVYSSALPFMQQWTTSLGGPGNDMAYSIQQTSDGGYIAAGSAQNVSTGLISAKIYKLDSNGNQEWFVDYGGTGGVEARSVQQTSDGGYIVAGNTSNTNNYDDCFILKLSSLGGIEWHQDFGTASNERANVVQQTVDGGYIVAGVSSFYGLVVKYNSLGNVEWSYTSTNILGSVEGFKAVKQAKDGSYILVGSVFEDYNTTKNDGWLVRLNSTGTKLWEYTYGSIGVSENAEDVIPVNNGNGYTIGGYKYNNGAFFPESWMFNVDNNGSIQWERTIDSLALGREIHSLIQASDGGYLAAGSSYTNSNWDMMILKTDANGNYQWKKDINTNVEEHGLSIGSSTDGGCIVAGYKFITNTTDFFIGKLELPSASITSSSGTIICGTDSITLTASAGGTDYLWSTAATTQSISVNASGTFSVTVDHCYTASKTLTAYPNTLPAPATPTGPLFVCAGQSVQYTVEPITGADPNGYHWNIPPGMTLTSDGFGSADGIGTNTITVSINSTGNLANLKALATNPCVSGPLSAAMPTPTLLTTIPPTPTAINGKTGTDYGYCGGTSRILTTSPSILGAKAATGFNWSIVVTTTTNTTYTFNNAPASITINLPVNYTSAAISVVGVNCIGTGTGVRTLTIKPVPPQPGAISGTTFICPVNADYTFSTTGAAGASSYDWNVSGAVTPASITAGGTSATFHFNSGFTTGAVTVMGRNACGTGAVRNLTGLTKTPAPPSISGAASACSITNPVVNYSIASVANANNYTWSSTTSAIKFYDGVQLPANPLTTVKLIISVNFSGISAGNKSLKVVSNGTCASSSAASKTVSVSACREANENSFEENKDEMKLFPNPAHSHFTIQFNSCSQCKYSLKLIDELGRVALEKTGEAMEDENAVEFDVAALTRGIYTLQLFTNEASEQKRIVIQ